MGDKAHRLESYNKNNNVKRRTETCSSNGNFLTKLSYQGSFGLHGGRSKVYADFFMVGELEITRRNIRFIINPLTIANICIAVVHFDVIQSMMSHRDEI